MEPSSFLGRTESGGSLLFNTAEFSLNEPDMNLLITKLKCVFCPFSTLKKVTGKVSLV